ncbi:hypothetical protein A2774_03960 [Candidatus Roizmanbacteria bacterium RIFCSPHIGHO2_01_FULL_39_12c]|uniref:UDP-N-acetylmuramyl-tripeptide synthetase n=1 Tax=Candidatus Roizmanbacteria bacterium RIFCSPHIGHO2_01_FULL_39_12c TaxID=1802031 RepID=A0A1F7GEL0_9BACT|nr:MAG: hypothetical protein A2774_03960 [Candidatus Roizmanbacteria bacterium RIFCSPHIGHO2_01_FULL_39_12c]OGK48052.1 MAG: hypothetical protein A2963_03775 [Candidatus Roizmanbacteria bacterium RIFCSPLOWO2_01_FULL_40_13]
MIDTIQDLKNFYHFFQSVIANLRYGFPGRKLKLIGVTGTDGKTTTTHLIYHILKSSGKKVSLISSVFANIAGRAYGLGFHVTTPDVFPLHNFFRQSAAAGDEYFVLETTSHALEQNRVSLVKFEIGVITNITHEHLDFHKTYKNYVKAKSILLKNSKIGLVNADDQSFALLKKIPGSRTRKLFTYALKKRADFRKDLNKDLRLNLTAYNNYNYLAAYSVCKILSLPDRKIFPALKSFQLPPGRLEFVVKKPLRVIIDFAHTPNALHQVLSEVKAKYVKKGNRLIHVFGSAAKRDKSKRPIMGKESAGFADLIILTEEDYRDEDPQKICREIAVGIHTKGFRFASSYSSRMPNKSCFIEIDRQKAITKAIALARPGDVVITTGKSHEKSLCRGKTEYPWSEHQAVKVALKIRSSKSVPAGR